MNYLAEDAHMTMIKTTLAEQAYQELRNRIIQGRLPEGFRLLPNELAVDLGISPTPIKEACLRLEADGLVTTSSRRGMVVRSFGETDVEALYAARILIEKGAVEAAFDAGRFDQALQEKLAEALAQHKYFATHHSLDDLSKALHHDRAFHSMLVDAARMPIISETHARIVAQTHTVFVSLPGDYSRSVGEHQEILNAIKAGNKDKIVQALKQHLEMSRHNTLNQVAILKARKLTIA